MRARIAFAAVAASIGMGAATAGAAGSVHCGSVRVDQFLHPAKHGTFGAFGIAASGVRCSRARRLAKRYVLTPTAPEHVVKVLGWKCKPRPSNVAQQVKVRCTLGSALVTFRDEIPNG